MRQFEICFAAQLNDLHSRLARLQSRLVREIEEATLATEHEKRQQHVDAGRGRQRSVESRHQLVLAANLNTAAPGTSESASADTARAVLTTVNLRRI